MPPTRGHDLKQVGAAIAIFIKDAPHTGARLETINGVYYPAE